MRVLFDQGTPDPLRKSLTQHNVSTAYEKGWSKLRNGALLDTAEREGYEVLVTTDTNLTHSVARPLPTGISRRRESVWSPSLRRSRNWTTSEPGINVTCYIEKSVKYLGK